jgi:hypothetical protein
VFDYQSNIVDIDSGQNSEIIVRLQVDPENLKNRSSDVIFMLSTQKGDISLIAFSLIRLSKPSRVGWRR